MNPDQLRHQFDNYLKRVKDDWNYITPEALKKEIDQHPENYFLLDVRKKSDYAKGHIPGSVNIFWLELFQSEHYLRLPRDKTIIVICYVGHTASQILTLLKLLNFDAVGLKFGIGATPIEGVPVASWSQFGFPMEHHHDDRGYCIKPQQEGGKAESNLGFTCHLVEMARQNQNYRQVLYTTPQQQLVLMSLSYLTEIGMERHPTTTQLIAIVSGKALAYVGSARYQLIEGDVLVVPPGANHNLIATSKLGVKLYTVYSPPEHPNGLIQSRKPLSI
jgi:rhodanese-related sulfurtransferase/mannose-6-phosphate isomerase-like protein (cupin superfamily)